jgi:putative hydrolase of the HAD superfamily
LILLLDIDGVLQFKHPDLEPRLIEQYGITTDFLQFQRDLFSDRRYSDTLIGEASFVDLLASKFAATGITADATEFTQQWLMGETNRNNELMDFTASLQTTRVCLATNQEPMRGGHIRKLYQTHGHIERIYISHELGFRKPDLRYFSAIVNDMKTTPDQMVFVDDFKTNVDAASRAGIRSVHFQSTKQVISALTELGVA